MAAPDSVRPDFKFEAAAHRRGLSAVCGVDEAGRGPWAGPVVAAAVILKPRRIPRGINDSKKLTPAERELLYSKIVASSAAWAVGVGDIVRIETDNILGATMWAMCEAIKQLAVVPDLALIDGNRAPKLSCEGVTIVCGDERSLSIAAASIIAKVTRDRMMVNLHAQFPHYGFASHKGYGTPEHQAALERYGPCVHHRAGFAPVRECSAINHFA